MEGPEHERPEGLAVKGRRASRCGWSGGVGRLARMPVGEAARTRREHAGLLGS